MCHAAHDVLAATHCRVEVTYPDEQQQQEQGEQAPDSPLSRNSPASEDDNAVAPAAQQSDADGTAPNGDSDSTSSAPGTAPARISWVEGGTRWAEVSIGVLCSGEDTHALPFALRLRGENEFPMATADALVRQGLTRSGQLCFCLAFAVDLPTSCAGSACVTPSHHGIPD